jgi:virulence factor Mce-like protein
MVTQAPKRAAVLAATAFVLSCIGLMIFVWTQFAGQIPFAPTGYEVHAMFPETGQLVAGADVRISGVNVGKVSSVQPRDVNSLVTMDLKQQYAPIPADTRAILRLKTLLGEAYVEFSTGTRSGAQLRDGGTIPRSQVESTQNLDQVLNSFNTPTQQALQQFLNGTFTGLAGRGQDINDAIGNLDPTFTELAAVVGELNQQQGDVRSLINNLGTVFTTLGQRSSDLQTLVTAGDQVLSATAQRNRQLIATVNALPPFMTELRTTLHTLNTTLGLAQPTLAALTPVAPLVQPALSDLISLSGPALKLLHQAPTLLNDASSALPAITRFTSAFKPALDAVVPSAQQIAPMISYIGKYSVELTSAMANIGALLNPVSTAATTQAVGTAPAGMAHLAFVLPPINNEILLGQTVREPTNRHNPYPSPGEWSNWPTGLLSSDCNNINNVSQVPLPLGSGNVPCRTQPGFAFNGLTQYYPHVTQAPK